MNQILLHPTYFPSIVSFSFLVSNPCVLEVSDNYQKQTYRNRTYIYGANGKQLLSIPIQHTKTDNGRQLYKDVKIDNATSWQKIHWKTLETAYRTSPFFEFYEDDLVEIFQKKFNFLIDLNLKTISCLLSCLQVDIQRDTTQSYQENYDNLQDFRFLCEAKKEKEIDQEEYYQIFSEKHGFIKNLSVLDLLFHHGNLSHDYLLNFNKNFTP